MKFCAIDIETKGRNPQFKSGALWSDEAQFYSESHEEFIAAMRFHAKKRYTFAAHNAQYDSSVALWSFGQDLSIHYINDTYDCGYWTWGSARQRAQIWDTVRLCAGMTLEELGESIGVSKYSTPQALTGEDNWRPSWVCDTHGKRECLECYNLRDAEIVWCWVNMLREWCEGNLIDLKRSLPSTAIELWRAWDVDKQQSVYRREIRELARRAYHGPRCEVFKYGSTGYVNTYDIRSHYGAILASTPLPDCTTLRYSEDNLDFESISGHAGVVDATVWIEPQHVPPLPANADNRLYFPVGTVRDCWSISELGAATKRGATVLGIHRAAYTAVTYEPFANLSRGLLELREEAIRKGDPKQLIYKFLLNATIGRMGMRDHQVRRIYRRWTPGKTAKDWFGYDLESSANQVFAVKEIGRDVVAKTSNVLWAAIILAEGRIRLLPHLLAAGNSVVYCDTDSVHSQTQIPTGDNAPGQLVSKGDYHNSLYLGPKLYRLESHDGRSEVRAKGVPRKFADDYVKHGTAHFQTTLSIRDAVHRGMPAATWVDVQRTLGYGLGSRTIHDAAVLRDHDGYSPTSPVVFASDPDGSTTVTNDELR